MTLSKATGIVATIAAAAAFSPLEATAQTASSSGTTTSGGSIAPNGVQNPYRFIGGTDVTSQPHPNLNPLGANFSDCEQNLMLQFPLVATGFTTGDHVEVWAGIVDCAIDQNRSGATASGAQLCWQVAKPITLMNTATLDVNVYVRDATCRAPSATFTAPSDRRMAALRAGRVHSKEPVFQSTRPPSRWHSSARWLPGCGDGGCGERFDSTPPSAVSGSVTVGSD
jgi:hypothetical protein